MRYSLFFLLSLAQILYSVHVIPASSDIDEKINFIGQLISDDPNLALEHIAKLKPDLPKDEPLSMVQLLQLQAEAYSALALSQETLVTSNDGIDQLHKHFQSIDRFDNTSLVWLSKLYSARSDAYYYLNDYSSSQLSAEESLRIARMSSNKIQIASALISYAEILDIKGNHALALQRLNEALNLPIDEDEFELQGLLYSTMGNLYISIGNELTAIEYYKKAIEAYRGNNKLALNILNYNIANALQSNKKNNEALTYLEKVITLSQELNDQSSLAYAYFTTAEIYTSEDNFSSAIEKYLMAHSIASLISDNNVLIRINISLSHAYLQMNNPLKSEQRLKQAEKLMGENPSAAQLIDWHYENSKLAEHKGDYKTAYNHVMKYAHNDHLYYMEMNSEQMKKLKNNSDILAMELARERLEKQNAMQTVALIEARADRQKYYNLTISIIAAFCFLSIIFIKQKKNQKLLSMLATRDDLTGLVNRRLAQSLMFDEFNRWSRYGQAFCVALIDIDHFKKFNDNYGHSVGDQILVEFSRSLKSLLRRNDILARWGGEEFILLLPIQKLQEAITLGERLLEAALSITFDNITKVNPITFSMGVAEVKSTDESVDTLFRRADAALYKAKRNGRKRIEAAE